MPMEKRQKRQVLIDWKHIKKPLLTETEWRMRKKHLFLLVHRCKAFQTEHTQKKNTFPFFVWWDTIKQILYLLNKNSARIEKEMSINIGHTQKVQYSDSDHYCVFVTFIGLCEVCCFAQNSQNDVSFASIRSFDHFGFSFVQRKYSFNICTGKTEKNRIKYTIMMIKSKLAPNIWHKIHDFEALHCCLLPQWIYFTSCTLHFASIHFMILALFSGSMLFFPLRLLFEQIRYISTAFFRL